MPIPGSSAARRALIAVGSGLAIAAAMAPAASADFSILPCTGEGVQGRGSSFQNAAITGTAGFNAVFKTAAPTGCGSDAPSIQYDPAGSGAGRAALGQKDATLNPNQDRDPSVRFGGTDQAPNPTERQQIQNGPLDANGQDATAADNDPVHVIPIAIGAIAIVVHLPDGCNYAGALTGGEDRPRMTDTALEGIFAGTIGTWGAALPGLAGSDAGCAGTAIKRVVRKDSSGTSFALKQFLADINPTRGWGALGNTAWPTGAGTTAVIPGDGNGGGSLRDKLNATSGGIGYIDLATARGGTGSPFTWTNAADVTFWVPVENRNSGQFADPQLAATGYKTNDANRGANCQTATPKGGALPADSLSDWSKVDYTDTATGYPACTLTYDLAFDDDAVVYCNSASEERKARTVKDFMNVVISTAGQNSLVGSDYDRLPADALAKATAAVGKIGFKKDGTGRPCTTPTPTPPATGGGGGGGTTPPPAAPSNAFTLSSARVSGLAIRLSLQLPGAGKVTVTSSTKPKRGKTITLAAKSLTVTKSGAQTLSISLSAKAKSALKRDKKLKVTLKITFTPTGGTAKTTTKTVTVKQTAKK